MSGHLLLIPLSIVWNNNNRNDYNIISESQCFSINYCTRHILVKWNSPCLYICVHPNLKPSFEAECLFLFVSAIKMDTYVFVVYDAFFLIWQISNIQWAILNYFSYHERHVYLKSLVLWKHFTKFLYWQLSFNGILIYVENHTFQTFVIVYKRVNEMKQK